MQQQSKAGAQRKATPCRRRRCSRCSRRGSLRGVCGLGDDGGRGNGHLGDRFDGSSARAPGARQHHRRGRGDSGRGGGSGGSSGGGGVCLLRLQRTQSTQQQHDAPDCSEESARVRECERERERERERRMCTVRVPGCHAATSWARLRLRASRRASTRSSQRHVPTVPTARRWSSHPRQRARALRHPWLQPLPHEPPPPPGSHADSWSWGPPWHATLTTRPSAARAQARPAGSSARWRPLRA